MNLDYNTNPAERPRDAVRRETRPLIRKQVILGECGLMDIRESHRFRCTLPSSRLRLKVGVSVFGKVGTYATTCTLSLQPAILDAKGEESILAYILTGQQLPAVLEAVTAADVIYGDVLLRGYIAYPFFDQGKGNLIAVATWEPTNEMSAEEWEAVQKECNISRETPYNGSGDYVQDE